MRVHSIFSILNLALVATVTATTIPRGGSSHEDALLAPRRPVARPNKRTASKRQCADVQVTFDELVSTAWGESIVLVGSIAELGNWDTSSGVSLSASQYTTANPLWSANVSIAAGTSFAYKYVRIGTDGSVNWEADPNHSYTVSSSCGSSETVSSSWQSASSTTAATTTATASSSTTTSAPTASCTNGPTSRSCWSPGYDINTDFDEDWPSTGRTVTYDFVVTNATLAPDGYKRQGFAINGQFPGPTIYADWGDMIQITVKNELQNNGTGIHFHGMRMLHNNNMDGVPGVTECPIPPGGSKTYTLQATQYGTSWYHSHFSAQYGDGVWGPIVIYGPATADYDIDVGPLPIEDWYYPGAYATSARAQHENALAPTADNGLINGTMVSNSGGKYAQTILTAGKKHRLRLVNTGIDNHFMFSLDNHTLTVISADFVPIVPYNTTWIFLGIGERYDVIITADQAPGSYWFRAEPQDKAGCGSNFNNGNIRSIFSYEGYESEIPSSSATSYTQRCTDETQLVPWWDSYVPQGTIVSNFTTLSTAINQSTAADGSLTIYWQVNGVHLRADWGQPTVGLVSSSPSTAFPPESAIIELDSGVWTYWVITEGPGSPFNVNIPHPIHLHGHDFYVLGSGSSAWQASDAQSLNYQNPTRRDTTMLPTNGWVALAFYTSNPGAWLMHCHIVWHADEGFAVQFLESKSTMPTVDPLPSDFDSQCAAWKDYYPTDSAYLQDDSGI